MEWDEYKGSMDISVSWCGIHSSQSKKHEDWIILWIDSLMDGILTQWINNVQQLMFKHL